MNLSEFKALLKNEGNKYFRLKLPNGSPVPVSFHVTEIGRVQKTFIDCGGVMRETVSCQLQIWVGEDFKHRIEAQKAAAILEKARSFLPDESIPVEFEYEDEVISQYVVAGHDVTANAVIFRLEHKHTDCLAKELCGVPAGGERKDSAAACCGPTGCC